VVFSRHDVVVFNSFTLFEHILSASFEESVSALLAEKKISKSFDFKKSAKGELTMSLHGR